MKINDPVAVIAPPQNRGLADEVTDWLRESILRGHLAPGQHLLEEELADKLKVSRGPIRDALIQLEHEGLVLVRRHRGAFVAQLSLTDAEEIFSLQLALERLAAESAAKKATEADWQALEAVIVEMRQAEEKRFSQSQVAALDMRFDDLIFQTAHHERLANFWSNLRSQVYILLLSSIAGNQNYLEGLAEAHTLILDALRTGNPNLAGRILQDHLMRDFEARRNPHTSTAPVEHLLTSAQESISPSN